MEGLRDEVGDEGGIKLKAISRVGEDFREEGEGGREPLNGQGRGRFA